MQKPILVVKLIAPVIKLTILVVKLIAPFIKLSISFIKLTASVVKLRFPGHGQGFFATGFVGKRAEMDDFGSDNGIGNNGECSFVPFFINFITQINDCPRAVCKTAPTA
jgi:hypothetical protein